MFRKPALEVTWEDWNLVLDTKLARHLLMSQAVARHMIPENMAASLTSARHLCRGYAGWTSMRQSGGVKQLTMSLAGRLGRHGLTVNCLAPGWFKTKQKRLVMYENGKMGEYLWDRKSAQASRPNAQRTWTVRWCFW